MTSERKSGGWMKWALAVSLGLNLIVVGLVAGAAWRFADGPRGDRRFGPAEQNYGSAFVRALPEEARRSLHRKIRSEMRDVPSRSERRAMFAQMVEVLRSDPFDPGAVRAILARQAEAAQGVRARAEEGWLELVSAMTPAERAAVADRMEAAVTRWREKRADR